MRIRIERRSKILNEEQEGANGCLGQLFSSKWFSGLIVLRPMVLGANCSGATGSAATGSAAPKSRPIGPITEEKDEEENEEDEESEE